MSVAVIQKKTCSGHPLKMTEGAHAFLFLLWTPKMRQIYGPILIFWGVAASEAATPFTYKLRRHRYIHKRVTVTECFARGASQVLRPSLLMETRRRCALLNATAKLQRDATMCSFFFLSRKLRQTKYIIQNRLWQRPSTNEAVKWAVLVCSICVTNARNFPLLENENLLE